MAIAIIKTKEHGKMKKKAGKIRHSSVAESVKENRFVGEKAPHPSFHENAAVTKTNNEDAES